MAEEIKKAGDACKLVDGTDGVLAEQEGGLVCVAKEADASETPADAGAGSESPSEGADAPTPEKAVDDSDKSHDDGSDK